MDAAIVLAVIEPSVADAMAAIEAADDLKEDKRRHWACSLRVVAKALGKPPELVPARWTALRLPLSRLHHGQMGMTAKTLANHKANVRAALSWFAKEENVPLRGSPLSETWTNLSHAIASYRTRANLSSLMRYCSASSIDPEEVTERTLTPAWPITAALKVTPRRGAGSQGPGTAALMPSQAGRRSVSPSHRPRLPCGGPRGMSFQPGCAETSRATSRA